MDTRPAIESITLALLLLFLLAGCGGGAQEGPNADTQRTVLFENDEVLVVETRYPPSATTDMHVHRNPHVAYVIDGGSIEVTGADSAVTVVEAVSGEVLWRGPQSHSSRNVGSTPVRLVEVEIKHAAAGVSGDKEAKVFPVGDMKWETDSVDPNRQIANLVGSLTEPGPYTVRLRASDYVIRLHQHPLEDEYLTVISGKIFWSTGATGSDAPEYELGEGGFWMFPAGMPHRLRSVGPVELQLTGVGPRTYEYLE